jgi:uncharacterized protein YdeI (YjbR/CyaY-like superfamily)
MELYKDTPIFMFKTPKEWETWLSKNHDKFTAVWIKFAKKGSRAISITYDEALEVALCYGWIDGLINAYNEQYYLTRFTPRKPKSVWSKRNVELVERLIREGKMRPRGLALIEAAKASGSWHAAYDGSKNMQIPEDFLKELAKDKKAQAFFDSLTRINTYAIAWRIQTAKRPETRKKRMENILEMLKKGEKFH